MRTKTNYSTGTESLHKLLELGFDTEASYEELKSNAPNLELIGWLEKKQELTTDFILKILTLLQSRDISPKSSYTTKGKLCKIWLDVKLRFLKFDSDLIIRECHKIDDLMLNILSKEIESRMISNEIHHIYFNYKNKLTSLIKPHESQELLIG
tara:strand:- start:28337 stop:28795 length:459 start_codon:yes stop_codon:yes gene_type:complete